MPYRPYLFFWTTSCAFASAGCRPAMSLVLNESLYAVDEQTPGTVAFQYLRMWNPVHLGLPLSSVVYQTYSQFPATQRRLSWPHSSQVPPKRFAASGRSLWAVSAVRPCTTAGARCACRRPPSWVTRGILGNASMNEMMAGADVHVRRWLRLMPRLWW